jgi:hypothetical protein
VVVIYGFTALFHRLRQSRVVLTLPLETINTLQLAVMSPPERSQQLLLLLSEDGLIK